MLATAAPSSAPPLALSSAAAGYGAGDVVRDITLDVRPGETFGLIGLNGAGKTTLIKVILGLMEASAGQVRVFGAAPRDGAVRALVAYLPEKFEPPAFLSGLEFIRFSRRLYGRAQDDAAADAAAQRLSLSSAALRRRVGTYSKGMRQKAGLIGTWLTECPLLILDEPMSGLDPAARVQVKNEIAACRARGMTVFLSSHILSDMDEICDRVGVIHNGALTFIGTPAALKKQAGADNLERAFLNIIGTSERVYDT